MLNTLRKFLVVVLVLSVPLFLMYVPAEALAADSGKSGKTSTSGKSGKTSTSGKSGKTNTSGKSGKTSGNSGWSNVSGKSGSGKSGKSSPGTGGSGAGGSGQGGGGSSAVPEPASIILLGLGGALLGVRRWIKRLKAR